MQKFYTMNLYAALVASFGLALWLIVVISSPLIIDSSVSLLLEVALFLAFLLLNLFFYIWNKERRLRLPQFISERSVKVYSATTIFLFIVVTACVFYSYPYAPIRPDAGSFTDKAGNTYTYQQFRNFQKWEVSYMTLWDICAIHAVALLPFYDKQSKKWKFSA